MTEIMTRDKLVECCVKAVVDKFHKYSDTTLSPREVENIRVELYNNLIPRIVIIDGVEYDMFEEE